MIELIKKTLGKFGIISTVDETYFLPVFIPGLSNNRITPRLFTKSQSVWKSLSIVTANAGGGQTNATQVNSYFTLISVCATRNDSVKMPDGVVGHKLFIVNTGAQAALVYPKEGQKFAGKATDEAVPLPVNSYMECVSHTTGVWLFRPLVGVYTGETPITAFAGGGQANAYQLRNEYNLVDTVATPGDSVKLKAATRGARQVVRNTSGNALDVFPQSGDKFRLLAINAATSVGASTTVELFCFGDGIWEIL